MTFMWSSAQNYLKIIYHPDVSQDLLGTHTWPLSNLVIRRRGRGAVIMAAAAAAAAAALTSIKEPTGVRSAISWSSTNEGENWLESL